MNKQIFYNNDIRNKQKNLELIENLRKFKKYRRYCKDCLNEINSIIASSDIKNILIEKQDDNSKLTGGELNDTNTINKLNDLCIYNYKLKLNILKMVLYCNKISN
jgi:hypothetical protein